MYNTGIGKLVVPDTYKINDSLLLLAVMESLSF